MDKSVLRYDVLPPSCTHLSGALGSLLQPPAVGGPAVGSVAVVCDEEVVKEDVGGHGPELEPHGAERSHPERVQVLKERRVGDLPRLPDALRTETSSGQDPKTKTPDSHLRAAFLFVVFKVFTSFLEISQSKHS